MLKILHERPEDAALIEPLLEKCFGPQRVTKTAYKIREKISPYKELSFIVREEAELLATIRYWPLEIDKDIQALLLGPIAVEPNRQGQKIGVNLIRTSLAVARELGHRIVILVGDPKYYGQFGFVNAGDLGLEFPGPVEPHRFLAAELVPGSLDGVSGRIEGGSLPLVAPGHLASKDETEALLQRLSTFAPPADTEKT